MLQKQSVYLPLLSQAYQLESRLYRAWRQWDGFSCGVYVVHWFDIYVSKYVLTPDEEVLIETEPLSATELDKVRYKIFCYVYFGMVRRSDK